MLPSEKSNFILMFAFFLAQLYPLLGDGNVGLFEQDKDQVLVLNGTNLGEFVVD